MILTRDYKPVFAAFNTPEGFELIADYPGVYRYKFTVWPFEYNSSFTSVDGSGELWEVVFLLVDVLDPSPRLRDYLQGVYHKEISMDELPGIIEGIKRRPMSNLNLGQEKQVFSTLFQTMGDFVNRENPRCLYMSSANEKKFRVYQNMARRYMPNWEMSENSDFETGMTLCRREIS
jgi:hypothetical protein